ncbi:MAG: serine/threonine protein kinase [Symploca sp. SIO2C1]|nr:serine/threonine protein kinase [Symploca sp. SIO2C1]
MSNYPDWSSHGYQILSELGHNSLGGRVTYQAKRTKTQQKVVIKQFQFAALGSTWAEYEAWEQEMTLLRNLDHPNIPRYLDSFQTPEGLCIVQEYIKAQSLAVPRRWAPKGIKQVALTVLRILVYLQRQNPPIIHRDIKPENILINDQLKVYLVDFGFARSGGGEIAGSSVVKGTMGFMPPEQLFNRELTTASDLYGLGVSLICLLTGTKSTDIGNLIDTNYCLHFQHLVPALKLGWISWLQKMVEPRVQARYANAAEALAALETIDVYRLPKVRLTRNRLRFICSQYPEQQTQSITISNPIPDTMLAGYWEVAPHPSDPPHTPYDHSWISFSEQKFEGNEVECEITVDTSKLLAGETYTRKIILHSNSSSQGNKIKVRVQTAPLPQPQKPAYLMLLGLIASSCIPLLLVNLLAQSSTLLGNLPFLGVLLIFCPVFVAWDRIAATMAAGYQIGIWNRLKAGIGGLLGIIAGACLNSVLVGGIGMSSNDAMFFAFSSVGIVMGIIWGTSWGMNQKKYRTNRIKEVFLLSILTVLGLILFAILGAALLLLRVPLKLSVVRLVVVIAILVSWLVYEAIWQLIEKAIAYQINKGFEPKEASQAVILSLGLGICLALLTVASLTYFNNDIRGSLGEKVTIVLLAIAPVLTITFLRVKLLIYQPFKRNQLIAQYLHNQHNLIKP